MAKSKDTQADAPPPFITMLAGLEHGKLAQDLNTEWNDLIRTVCRHARNTGAAKGRLTLNLDVVGDQDGQIILIGKSDSKTPKPVRGKSIRYQTADGDLSENDPRQQEMFDGRTVVTVEDTRGTVARVEPRNTNGKDH